jgi:hypothetical protein
MFASSGVRPQTLVATDTTATADRDCTVVRTPLELVRALDDVRVGRVILRGRFATEQYFAEFIRESFPMVDVA